MECRDLNKLIDAYFDRELPPGQRREVEEHLAGCPACGRLHGRLAALLSERERPAVPAGLAERISARIAHLPHDEKSMTAHPATGTPAVAATGRRRAPWFGYSGLLAAACLAMAIILTAYFNGLPSTPSAGFDPGEMAAAGASGVMDPVLAAGWTQGLAISGQWNPLAAAVHATTFKLATDATLAAAAEVELCRRPLASDLADAEEATLTPAVPIILTNLAL